MALHRLTSITIGVPDVAATAAYYEEFGLSPIGAGRFATVDGGEQLALVPAPCRRLLELGIGVDDPDDLARVATSLGKLGVAVERTASSLAAVDPGTQARIAVAIAELSAVLPLLPGDVIFTGTPAGIGATRKPPRFLEPGEVLTSYLEGIGTLRNRLVAAPHEP